MLELKLGSHETSIAIYQYARLTIPEDLELKAFVLVPKDEC